MTTQVALQVQLNMDFRVRHSAPGVVQPAVVQSAPDPTAVWRLLRVDDKVSQPACDALKPLVDRIRKGFFHPQKRKVSQSVTKVSQGGLGLHQASNLESVTVSRPLYSSAGLEQMFAFFDSCAGVVFIYSIYITYSIYIHIGIPLRYNGLT
jgi:hypothetical protein